MVNKFSVVVHCSVYFIFFLFGAHVIAVFLPLSPASTLVCYCFSHFGLLLVFRLFFFFHILCCQINLI